MKITVKGKPSRVINEKNRLRKMPSQGNAFQIATILLCGIFTLAILQIFKITGDDYSSSYDLSQNLSADSLKGFALSQGTPCVPLFLFFTFCMNAGLNYVQCKIAIGLVFICSLCYLAYTKNSNNAFMTTLYCSVTISFYTIVVLGSTLKLSLALSSFFIAFGSKKLHNKLIFSLVSLLSSSAIFPLLLMPFNIQYNNSKLHDILKKLNKLSTFTFIAVIISGAFAFEYNTGYFSTSIYKLSYSNKEFSFPYYLFAFPLFWFFIKDFKNRLVILLLLLEISLVGTYRTIILFYYWLFCYTIKSSTNTYQKSNTFRITDLIYIAWSIYLLNRSLELFSTGKFPWQS